MRALSEHAPSSRLRLYPLLALGLVLGACAGDISPPSDDTAGDGSDSPGTRSLPGPGGAQTVFSQHRDGYYQAEVDAAGEAWIYLDLDTQTQVQPDDPAGSDAWDIALLGPRIKLNGGVSGAPPTGHAVAVYADKVDPGSAYPFEDVVAAPPNGQVDYVTDAAGGLFGLGEPDYAMTTYPDADEAPNLITGVGDHGWYHDDGSTVSARVNAGYILRTVECRYLKLRMTGYSDATGAAGHPSFDLLEIPGPACETASAGDDGVAPLGRASFSADGGVTRIEVDAGDEELWVHLDLSNGLQVAPTQPSDDPTWDIALRRADIKLNGGTSGSAGVELHDGLRDDWDGRSTVPADAEWHSDTAGALAFVTYPPRETGGECAFDADGDYGWYYYSGFCDKGDGNHHISPRDVVYLLRGRDANVWKLRIVDYYGDDGTAAQFSIEYAPVADSP
ncbi:MAG: HmuY family protein [Nevskiales bacterium]|nr:HmuY family protein [Nevskiales bacterium]